MSTISIEEKTRRQWKEACGPVRPRYRHSRQPGDAYLGTRRPYLEGCVSSRDPYRGPAIGRHSPTLFMDIL